MLWSRHTFVTDMKDLSFLGYCDSVICQPPQSAIFTPLRLLVTLVMLFAAASPNLPCPVRKLAQCSHRVGLQILRIEARPSSSSGRFECYELPISTTAKTNVSPAEPSNGSRIFATSRVLIEAHAEKAQDLIDWNLVRCELPAWQLT